MIRGIYIRLGKTEVSQSQRFFSISKLLIFAELGTFSIAVNLITHLFKNN